MHLTHVWNNDPGQIVQEIEPIEGMVDQENQRVAWGIEGKKWPIMDTGLANLTKDTSGALIHFENGETQQWLMVRFEEPKTEN